MKGLKNLGKKVQEGARNFVSISYAIGSNLINDLADGLAQSYLENEVEKLMKINFKTVDKSECVKLIQKIKDLAITKEMDYFYNKVETSGKAATIKRGISSDGLSDSVDTFKDMNREYREWADGDAEKIYEVLRKHAIQNPDGKIKFTNLEDLKSDGLVWDFLEMIWEEITKFFGKKIDDKTVSAGDKYTAGKFAEKVVNTKGDKSLGK